MNGPCVPKCRGFSWARPAGSLLSLAHDRRGVTAMTFAVLAFVFLGVAGLATEVGGWYTMRASAQAAADSGAIAAALTAYRGGDDPATAAADAVARNGYPSGFATTTVLRPFDPAAGTWPLTETIVRVPVTPLIVRLIRPDTTALIIVARAVATMRSIGTACVLSTTDSLDITQPQLGDLCSYASNATGAAAINIHGVNAADVKVYAFTTSGDCAGCPPPPDPAAAFGRPVASYQPPTDNPYTRTVETIALPGRGDAVCLPPALVPDPATGSQRLVPAHGNTTKPWPGGLPFAYCGDMTIASGTRAVLTPGVYFFIDAALTVQDGASLECRADDGTANVCDFSGGGVATGVTLVFTGHASTQPMLRIGPSARVQLSAPRQGDSRVDKNFYPALHGVLFWRDGRMAPGTVDDPAVDIQAVPADPGLGAGDTASAPAYTRLNGLMYFPHAHVRYGANGVVAGAVAPSTCATLVAGAISLSNQPSTFQDCAGAGYVAVVPRVLAVRIVE